MIGLNATQTYNTTLQGLTGINTFSSFLPMVFLVSVSLVIIGMALYLPFFKRMRKGAEWFSRSLYYFVIGSGVLGTGSGIYFTIEFIGKTAEQSNLPWEVIAGYVIFALAGYFLIAGLGWLATKVYRRLKKNYKKVKK